MRTPQGEVDLRLLERLVHLGSWISFVAPVEFNQISEQDFTILVLLRAREAHHEKPLFLRRLYDLLPGDLKKIMDIKKYYSRLDSLAGKKYVYKYRAIESSRPMLVEITDDGRQLLSEIETPRRDIFHSFLSGLSPEEVATFSGFANRLEASLAEATGIKV